MKYWQFNAIWFQNHKKNTSVCIFFLIFTFWIFKKRKYAIVCRILYSIVPKNNHLRICIELRFTFYKPNKKKRCWLNALKFEFCCWSIKRFVHINLGNKITIFCEFTFKGAGSEWQTSSPENPSVTPRSCYTFSSYSTRQERRWRNRSFRLRDLGFSFNRVLNITVL